MRRRFSAVLAMVYLNRLHLTVVCSVIDTQYDVICGKNKKGVHEPPRRV